MAERVYLNRENQNDNVFGRVEMFDTKDFFGGREVASKMDKVIISNNKVVNTCSSSYALLDNQDFFGRMEEELSLEGLKYQTRSFNHNDSRFSVDYILNDESKLITVNDQKNNGIDDTIVPMIRLTNSYDGSLKTAGYLGFFRKICHNGMHMTTTQLEFKVKHTKGKMNLFIPNIEQLVQRFLSNEMFFIQDKIQKMKTHFIDEKQIESWIKELAKQDRVWVDNSEENYLMRLREAEESGEDLSKVIPAKQSQNIEIVKNILIRDAETTGVEPNAWLLYSAFNEFIHSSTSQVFAKQKELDTRVFNSVAEIAGAY